MKTPLEVHPKASKREPKSYQFSSYALQSDGAGERILVAGDPSIEGPFTDFTWIIWVRNDDQTGQGGVPRIESRENYRWEIVIGAGVAVALNNLGYTDGDGLWRDSGFAVPIGPWIQLILVNDDSIKTLYAYVNLNLVDTWNYANKFNRVDYGDMAFLATTTGDEGLKGAVTEIALYPWMLSAAEREESFRRGSAKVLGDCRLCLRTEEAAGLNTLDLSRYGNHGDLLPVATPPSWIDTPKYQLLAESEP